MPALGRRFRILLTGSRTRWLSCAAACLLAGCSTPTQPKAPEARPAAAPKITQFYAAKPAISPGEKVLVCYGVENAASVWLSPPRQEMTVSLSRCVEVSPSATTTYTLSARSSAGTEVTQDVEVQVGPPHVKIVEVQVSTVNLKRGDTVGICYKVEYARSVQIEPIHYRSGSLSKGCTTDQPQHDTTYLVTAIGESGDRDEEKAPVTVH